MRRGGPREPQDLSQAAWCAYRLYQPETRTSKYINKISVCWPAHILKDLQVWESLVVVDGDVASNLALSLAETMDADRTVPATET